MLRRIFVLIFLLLLGSNVYSANVEVDSDVYLKETIFKYTIKFSEDESYSSFSFEKPKNSIIEHAYDKNNISLFYSVAGDYFIFKPEHTINETFYISFKTADLSNQIINKNVFSLYVNFNIPVENFQLSLNFVDEMGEIKDIFPRNYQIGPKGEFVWNLKNLEKDTLFLINFENFINLGENNSITDIVSNWYNDKYFILFVVVIIIVLVLLIIFGKKVLNILYVGKKELIEENSKSNQQNIKIKDETNKNTKILENKTEEGNLKKENPEKIEKKETYEEFVNKYLTENEREVVGIIKLHEGISQYDILNYLSYMTKSNLSKIISKLHSRKILNRIKVGKVNKIYLGEKLEIYKGEQ